MQGTVSINDYSDCSYRPLEVTCVPCLWRDVALRKSPESFALVIDHRALAICLLDDSPIQGIQGLGDVVGQGKALSYRTGPLLLANTTSEGRATNKYLTRIERPTKLRTSPIAGWAIHSLYVTTQT